MNLPHGYTNSTRLEGQTVVKTYSGADSKSRFLTELSAYRQLQEMSFMPKLVGYNEEELTISTSYVENRHGQDLIAEDYNAVPLSIGKLARELQVVRINTIAGRQRNESEVLVHGDFGPQNILFSQDSSSPLCLVDWEWTHFGGEYEDIAWAEWIIRMHYGSNPQMIASLYQGFGIVPPWEQRHELMICKCKSILDFAKKDSNKQSVPIWIDRITNTEAFRETT